MQPLVTFILPSYQEESWNIAAINSLIAQKDPLWKAIVFNNGPNDLMRARVQLLQDSRFTYEESGTNTGSWGTFNRATAVKYLVDTPYCIQSSIQDYWMGNAVEEINKQLLDEPDIITWPGLNHIFNYDRVEGLLEWSKIDWGQACIKTDHYKRTGIVRPQEFCADWFTFKEMMKQGLLKKRNRIEKTLTIHN